jgi:hypothetical protein
LEGWAAAEVPRALRLCWLRGAGAGRSGPRQRGCPARRVSETKKPSYHKKALCGGCPLQCGAACMEGGDGGGADGGARDNAAGGNAGGAAPPVRVQAHSPAPPARPCAPPRLSAAADSLTLRHFWLPWRAGGSCAAGADDVDAGPVRRWRWLGSAWLFGANGRRGLGNRAASYATRWYDAFHCPLQPPSHSRTPLTCALTLCTGR